MRLQQRKAHAVIWYVLAFLIPIIVVVGFLIKQDFSVEMEPVPLNERAEEIFKGNVDVERNN